ncbi:hypothetical protein PTTG_30051, partial [Puccinia triticina 1-1 BBBD Race 1]
MVDTRSGKDHSANPPPTKRGRGRQGRGGRTRGSDRGTPSSPQQSAGGRDINIQSDESRLLERQELRRNGSPQVIPRASHLVVQGRPEISPVEGDPSESLGRLEPLHGTQAHQSAQEQQTADKGKQRARSEETLQDPENRPIQTSGVGIEAETLRAKAKEEREQVERDLPHGPSAHGGQGRDRGI